MPNHRRSSCLRVLVVAWLLAPAMLAATQEDSPYVRTLERVLKVLPKQPDHLVVVDPDQRVGEVRSALLGIDAFITKGGRVVYLTSKSEALRGALTGSSLHEYALAAIIWHEMAHIDGADEIEAQRREETLWKQFVMEERVDRAEGMRYLVQLTARRRRDGAALRQDPERTLRFPITGSVVVIGRPERSLEP
jgi:hypothetical protein